MYNITGRDYTFVDILLCGICIVAVCFCVVSVSSAETTIRVGVYENKPLLFTESDKAPAGVFIEILEDIAQKEGWRLEYVHQSWHELMSMLEKGDLDLLPAVAYSKERNSIYSFTYESVVSNWAVLYGAKGSDITSLLELKGLKVGVKQGDIHFLALQEMTEKLDLGCRFIEAEDYITVFEMLKAGYVDAGVANRLVGQQYKEEYSFRETPVLFNPVEIRFAAPKDDIKEVITKLDFYLDRMKKNQESVYFNAINHWLQPEQESSLPQYFLYLLIVAAGLVVFFLGVTFYLRLKVKERTAALVLANQDLSREVEERLIAEEELRMLAEIVSVSSDAMALLDRAGIHLVVNQAYKDLVDYGLDSDLVGQTMMDAFGVNFHKENLELGFKQCIQGEVSQLKAIWKLDSDKKSYWAITFSPSSAPSSAETESVVLTIRDITEQHQLEEGLKNAQKMEAVGLLAGSVAHDLNNILSGIVGYPDMLLATLPADSQMRQPLSVIKQSGEKAAAVVSDLLTLARRGVDNRKPVDLNSIISDFLESPEHKMMVQGKERVRYKLAFAAESCVVEGNATQLQKIVMNLVSNALEAISGEGRLLIETKKIQTARFIATTGEVPRGKYITLKIADTGIGIDESNFSRIFEPFYTSKVMGSSGTGLGMTIVYGIVQDHGGYIDLTSRKGQGTVFKLLFPVTGASVAVGEQGGEDVSPWRGSGETVLVIDDMPSQRMIASGMLRELGYNVQVVESGEEGVHFLKNTKVDLVILDMIMPGGLDGLSTFKEIVKINSSQRTIIASGFSRSDHVYKAQRMGAGIYLKKPYTMLELAKTVYSTLV